MKPRERTLSRDVAATQIPSGEKVPLSAGTRVMIHQTLGGNYTVQADYGLFRIDGRDADALGEQASAGEGAAPQARADGSPDPEAIWEQLRRVYDPEIPVNIVDLGLVYSMELDALPEKSGFRVDVAMTLTAPGCGMGEILIADARDRLKQIPTLADAKLELVFNPPWEPGRMSDEARLQTGMF